MKPKIKNIQVLPITSNDNVMTIRILNDYVFTHILGNDEHIWVFDKWGDELQPKWHKWYTADFAKYIDINPSNPYSFRVLQYLVTT